ncbi:MAG: geranylgeranyl reductase family protein [Candidatus Burarchaeum sp.]|nr:geranylgeranyl reductase family protein [Candidatus Burarchaeum sp.]MDO8340318.1 geranylgeranyl reductase family protein [Candidatus Burarchaeum sp.]
MARESSGSYDIIVVGAGPGGSSCAALLGRKGYNVLLLDKAKFPREKTCGDAVSGKSLRVLRDLGIDKEIEKMPHASIRGVIFSSPKGVQLDIPFRGKPLPGEKEPGYCCKREIMDNLFFTCAKKTKGVTTMENFQVSDIILEGEQVVGVKGVDMNAKQEREFRANVIVGADGAQSVIARKTGCVTVPDPRHSCAAVRAYYTGVSGPKDRIELHFIDEVLPGYFWIFPVSETEHNIGLGMLTKDMQGKSINLKQIMLDAIEKNALFKERFKNAKPSTEIRGWTLPLGSKRQKAHGAGYVLIGDAASLIDPFTGEGVGNATTSAKIACDAIDKAFKANNFSANMLSVYAENLWAELGPEMQTSYNLQRAGKWKFLLNLVIGKAARKPEIREFIGGTFTNKEAKKQLYSPMFYFKLLFA